MYLIFITALMGGLAAFSQLSNKSVFANKVVKLVCLIAGIAWLVGSSIYFWRGGSIALTIANFLGFVIVVFIMPAFVNPLKEKQNK